MKTFYIGATVAAVLGCSAVNAQVLGGNVGGGLGGTLSGGLRDMSVITHGNGNGSFGADLDATSNLDAVRGTTSEIGGRVRDRAQSTTEKVRGRTESTLGKVQDKGEATASAVDNAATAASQTKVPQVDVTSAAEGSLASSANLAGNEASGTLEGAHQSQLVSAPAVTAPTSDAITSPVKDPIAAPISAPQTGSPAATSAPATSAAKPQLPKLADGANVEAKGSASASVKR